MALLRNWLLGIPRYLWGGWGAYHGEQGYLRFCHQKSVLSQSRFSMGHLLYPPYGARFERVMALLRRLP